MKNITQLMMKAPERYQNLQNITLESFENLIPVTVPKMIREDITYYFNYLRKERDKKSLKDWEKASNCTDSPNSWRAVDYRPIFSFLYYDRITEGLFLPLLLSKIESAFGKRSGEMSIAEFNKLCRLSIVGFKPSIDQIDLKILQVLSREPFLVAQEITEKIGHSYATVYHHLQELKSKMGLRITTRINWLKLGIQRIFLISKSESIFNAFAKYEPYVDGQASFLWGETYYLRYFFLNENRRREFIQIYQNLKNNEKQQINYYELTQTPSMGYNFDLYNLDEQRWDFDFGITFLKKDRQMEKANILLFNNNLLFKEPYKLTEMEIKIVDGLVGNYTLSQKEIANLLGIYAPNLSIVKNKLLNDNIINPQLMIRNFLPLYCILWCDTKSNDIIDTLIYLLKRIPFASISQVQSLENKEKKQLICILILDDVLYYSLVTFLLELQKDNLIDDFRLGLIVDSYFGMAKIRDVLRG